MYYLVYGFIYLISFLPFRILYIISDFFYIITYYLIRYRKSVVFHNLLIAFPDKSEQQREKIAKEFYHNLLDTFVESIKLISISKKKLLERCSANFELLDQLVEEGKNIQLQPGHQFNVEFYNLLYSDRLKKLSFVFVYMPISNKILDHIFFQIRSRFGSLLIPATDFRSQKKKFEGSHYAITLGSDQNPAYIQGAFWMNFFGKPVPFLPGPAKSAIKNNMSIVLVNFVKERRGYYRFENTLLTKNPSLENAENLTISYRNFIEEKIRIQPGNYLWTHKRWKHAFNPELHSLWIDRSI